MGLTGESKQIQEDGENKDAFVISFTNGALSQLQSLKDFLGADDPIEVVKVGISFLQKIKEEKEEKRKHDAK